MTKLEKVLMERDGLTLEEAQILIQECADDLANRLDSGEYAYDICEEYFGLEPDYILDVMRKIS